MRVSPQVPSPQQVVPRVVPDPEVLAIQTMLNAMGYDAGPADGIMGGATREAIRAYQRSIGATPTGRLTPTQFAALARREAPPKAKPAPTPGRTVDIRAVQSGLAARGYDVGTVDGIWGRRSQAALDAFRREQKIARTGGPTPDDAARLAALPQADVPAPAATTVTKPRPQDVPEPQSDLASTRSPSVAPAPAAVPGNAFSTLSVGGYRLASLPVVDKGMRFGVSGSESRGDAQDRLAIVPGGSAPHAGTPSVMIGEKRVATLQAPSEPGIYDIVWIDHRDGRVLVRRPLEVR
ncbi:peptidoglycan-binding domain-containing protein [Oceanibium sediminis]|uniref:peptidoglycan-binding domain-containing protein n=1 Tax=Oceanibium sediminis TaxID=2026339 RepID=UPI001300667A|nr:peptidoglycan-binding protein [Oceanibium sediminis]